MTIQSPSRIVSGVRGEDVVSQIFDTDNIRQLKASKHSHNRYESGELNYSNSKDEITIISGDHEDENQEDVM